MKLLTKKRISAVMLMAVLSFLLTACNGTKDGTNDGTNVEQVFNYGLADIVDNALYTSTVSNVLTDSNEDFVDDLDNDFKDKNTATIVLDDNNTLINNPINDTDIYLEDGNIVVVSTKKITLVISGTLNGSVNVYNTEGKVKLVLDGVDITSSTGPAINLQTVKRCFIVVNDETVNNITDGTIHLPQADGSTTNGAIFSENQVVFSGEGELNVTGNYKHGIVSDDYIRILSGTINILSAEKDGLHANDYIIIDGGLVTIDAGRNGINCEKGYIVINGGTLDVTAVNDGIKTSYDETKAIENRYIQINNGIINIEVVDQGIISCGSVILNQGVIVIETTGDAVSADNVLEVNDGIYYLHSLLNQTLDGDYGVFLNGGTSILLSEGATSVIESDESIIVINGGTIVAGGPTKIDLSTSTQGYIEYGSVTGNETINISDDDSIITVTLIQGFLHAFMSSPEMETGTKVTAYTNGTITGNNFYGLYFSGTYKNGEEVDTLEVK